MDSNQPTLQNVQPNQQTIPPVEKDHTSLVALLLVFLYPIGIILMWTKMKQWKTWVKVLITLPGVISMLFLLIPIVLFTIVNPKHTPPNLFIALQTARQKDNSSARKQAMSLIMAGIMDYQNAHNGEIPPGITTTPQKIAKNGADICSALIPSILHGLPGDVSSNNPFSFNNTTDCNTNYDTGFTVALSANNQVLISAPSIGNNPSITVTSQDVLQGLHKTTTP